MNGLEQVLRGADTLRALPGDKVQVHEKWFSPLRGGPCADPSRKVALKIAEVWRYPVKTMAGEKRQRAGVGLPGIHGDRVVHVEDARGRVITSRTDPRFLGVGDEAPLVGGRADDQGRPS